jgi:hypothetical protein
MRMMLTLDAGQSGFGRPFFGDGSCTRFAACALFGKMDSKNDLRRAEELVAEGRRIVQQQKGRVVRLRAAGVDTWEAERALRLFEANLRRFEEHRDFLKR